MSEPRAQIPDAEARERAVTQAGSVLVQAPAGSGKTTLLVNRYLRLLATVEAPENILALTFTRRAADEMRERVLGALRAAAAGSASPASAARRHLEQRGIDVERHPARLRIETIDAFNAWLAGQLPLTAGTGARLVVTEEPRPSYEEAARRALAYREADDFGAAVERLLEFDDQRWRSLVELIAVMLGTREHWLPLLAGRLAAASALDQAQLQALRRHLEEDLKLLIRRSLKSAHEAVGPERIAALSGLARAAALRAVDRAELAAWRDRPGDLRSEVEDAPRWQGLLGLLLTKQGGYRRRLTRAEGFPPGCADTQVMLDLIEELARDPGTLLRLVEVQKLPPTGYTDAQWLRVRDVAQVLMLAAAELTRVFRERGAVDFAALSMAALTALGADGEPTDLTLRLDYRLQHVLIDEFQDTSGAQLELLRLLTGGWTPGDGRSVFCVGDPMQSIYGFRQAEVRAFLELAEEGMGGVRFAVERLRSNFRSGPPVVAWINDCFARLMPRADDRDRGAIAFRPGEAVRRDASRAADGVQLRSFATRAAEADAAARSIGEQRAAHPDWRIAVLVRARTHAREMAEALRRAGIPFRAVEIEPLGDRPIVRDLVTLTRALTHLGDRTAWLALLRAPWVGLCLADLWIVAGASSIVWEALGRDDVLGRLSEDGRARCRRARRVLEAARRIRTHEGLARWVQRTWLALGGPACADDAAQLEHAQAVFARLEALEREGLPDPADLPARFEGLFAADAQTGHVEIMTIHKSKGLEFDAVVLPALDRWVSGRHDQLFFSHQFARSGRDGWVFAARPAVGGDAEPLVEFLRDRQRDAAALESQRLLYVACTRAKHRLWLSAVIEPAARDGDASGDSAGPPAWRPRAGSLLAVLWPVVGPEFLASAPAVAGPPAAARAPRGGPLRRVPRDFAPERALDSPDPAEAAPLPPSREVTPVFDWVGETARRVGILVHAQLQRLDLERTDPQAIRDGGARFERWLDLHGVPRERQAAASARVQAALIAVLGDERGRWILRSGRREDLREHALSGWDGGQIVHAVFDRSFVEDDGVRWVIDYKTSLHEGGGVEEFLDREVERHRPQMTRYAALARKLGPQPVRVGLYFPLMRAWREWPA